MSKKAQMHELLAVETDAKGVALKIRNETIVTFVKKTDHFTGFIKTHEYLDEDDKKKRPAIAADHKKMATTVQKKLDYTSKSVSRFFDVTLQKELTNQEATCDLMVEGMTLGTALPATFLLGMEEKLKELRKVYEVIPTYAPGVEWEKDTDKGAGVYTVKYPEESFQGETKTKPEVLYKHQFPKEGEKGEPLPAQVSAVSVTTHIGKYRKTTWTGMLSPAEKSDMLARLDLLMIAVKKARSKANTQEVVKGNIGNKLFAFIHGTDLNVK